MVFYYALAEISTCQNDTLSNMKKKKKRKNIKTLFSTTDVAYLLIFSVQGLFVILQDWNNLSFLVFMYIGGFAVPVAVIFYSYVGIVKAMFKHHKEMIKTASKMGATMTKSDSDKK